MIKTRVSQLYARPLAVALILATILFWIVHRTDNRLSRSGRSKNTEHVALVSTGVDLVGTWKGEYDNILNIRRDGTGRARNVTKPTKAIHYFEWRFDQQTFTLIDTDNNFLAHARDALVGEDSTDFTISSINKNEFDLINPLNGQAQRFVRVSDAKVEIAQ